MQALIAKAMLLFGSIVGSITEIEEEAVPETAAAHCNIHWTILVIIAIYGLYAVTRAGYIRKTLASGTEDGALTPADVKKRRRFFHLDTLIGIITLVFLALSEFYWTCYIDYRVAVCGAVIVIVSTVIMEIENFRLYNRAYE
ncbi:MAG: hypothetical protein IKR39_03070 [Lachnospiraceae bacterium]|nr:hypothetical protein [Lachnospiraceae bacterium]